MRACLLVAVLLGAVATALPTVNVPAGTVTTTARHPTDAHRSVTRVFTRQPPMPSDGPRPGVTAPTNAPVGQMHRMLVFFTNHCKLQFNKTSDAIFNGGYSVKPPPVIPPINDGFDMGMEATADPGSDRINGTVAYRSPKWDVNAAYFCVNDEWGFEISYETVLGVQIQGAVIGKTQVYDINLGHSANPFDMQC